MPEEKQDFPATKVAQTVVHDHTGVKLLVDKRHSGTRLESRLYIEVIKLTVYGHVLRNSRRNAANKLAKHRVG